MARSSRDSGQPDLAVLMSEIGEGGMGKMRIHLMNTIAATGLSVDLLLGKDRARHDIPLDARIRVLHLGTTHALFAVPRLAAYLRRHRPRTLLTQRVRVNVLAHRARRLARVPTRIFATQNTHMSMAVKQLPEPTRARRLRRVRRYFRRNDGILAISRGVAEDFAGLTGWPGESIAVVPNPVLQGDVDRLAAEPVEHPWFCPGGPPIVLGIGRLQAQKDFPTLIDAFARFRRHHEARLVILGEGHLRSSLVSRAQEHGIEADVDLPGFVDNVYACLARSRLFVLSSAWEGFGNVLVEAMAVGTPVVATDCPSGPAEILEDGHLGPLVPVGDVKALAEAMERVWEHPPDAELLQRSARERYSAERSAAAYISALGLDR